MIVLFKMHLETVHIFGCVSTIAALILIDSGMALHVTIKHRFVNAFVVAGFTFERFNSLMIATMVFKVMLVFRHELAPVAGEQLFWLEMGSYVLPLIFLVIRLVGAMATLVQSSLWHDFI